MTAPYFCSYLHAANEAYEMHEFERLTAELSARLWRNYGINTYKYWASGKIQALMRIQAPCALVDMDLLVWHPLELDRYALAAAHTEPLRPDIYPLADFFCVDEDYVFPCGWDWQAKPLNTSIVYFSEESFKEYYAHEAIRFMQSEKETPDDGSICMVFAEQRILAMCAAQRGILPHTFLNMRICAADRICLHTYGRRRGCYEMIGNWQTDIVKSVGIKFCS